MNHVTLDKKRPVRFTHHVLMQAEDDREKSFLNFDLEKLQWGDLITLCYYACKKADKEFSLTREEVADNFHTETSVEVMNAFASDMVDDKKK